MFDKETVIHTKSFEVSLLFLNLSLLLVFLLIKWSNFKVSYSKFFNDLRPFDFHLKKIDPKFSTVCLFTGFLIGMSCSRGIHS